MTDPATPLTSFAVDTTTPAPGPWRMPTDAERRTQVMFVHPFKDCTSVCEVHPDLENYTDATMRLIAAAPEMHELLQSIRDQIMDESGNGGLGGCMVHEICNLLNTIEGKS